MAVIVCWSCCEEKKSDQVLQLSECVWIGEAFPSLSIESEE